MKHRYEIRKRGNKYDVSELVDVAECWRDAQDIIKEMESADVMNDVFEPDTYFCKELPIPYDEGKE